MIDTTILLKAYRMMSQVKAMAETYEANRSVCKYVHSTSRGHEAIQLATAFQLQPYDFVSPYYRDESIIMGIGFTPYEQMLQLLAKGNDIFTGGREYYSHPNYNGDDKPTMIHQSSATGMQAIPTTGLAQGVQYLENHLSGRLKKGSNGELPIVICSLGDASITEGEVSEAFQFAVLKQLPIIYLVQDNDWGISVTADEARAMNAFEFAAGFKGMNRVQVDGSDFEASYSVMKDVCEFVRRERKPYLVHAQVPLLGHHTSGVRKEFYRSDDDWAKHEEHDPNPKLRKKLIERNVSEEIIAEVEKEAAELVAADFAKAVAAPDPDPSTIEDHIFAPTLVTEEKGERSPAGKEKVVMVDAALFAVRELMEKHPEAILYGQDVGKRLGGVFREAATLGEMFGDHRVFNTAIQEAYVVGSTVGMSAVGLKPIVEVQFADYIYPGFNQLVTEVSKSCYLSCGKFPVSMILRVPIGAYGGGGPYHSGSVETTVLSIKGIKVAYPSNAADMKGLMKAAYYDPNPVVMLEHKGLYWSKVPGTEDAKTPEPSKDYILPFGKANIIVNASVEAIESGESCVVITYGMGVYWAKAAAKQFNQQVEIVDLRTLYPLDEELIFERVKAHGKCLVLTEEQQNNSFAEALAGRISKNCFQSLDAAVEVFGALNTPAVPMNMGLEKAMLPDGEKVVVVLNLLLNS
ncbi:MAG: tungsten formylmethanofuran dehydrogenase [Chitinophagaceae bacterium]|nr:tungsten formylmethanofuran dehydrogenase [Chitinophagaceae bacterium]HQX96739.1 thiamine pyrophosphate-dependent enzyme [Chitinophagaceae bacterium]HQZ50233.1 thiamine pyrophosphate-dependent enzyme [Chitinophagaceae bacterium]HRA10605.1 thiamine pyrophosphate-dependent enzyme [Chitinophagaceae bacterium]